MAAAKRDRSNEVATIGDRLKFARKRIRMTQPALAAKVGLDASAISRLEANERLVELGTLIDLARALSIPTGWLVANEGELPPPPPVDPNATDRRRRAQS